MPTPMLRVVIWTADQADPSSQASQLLAYCASHGRAVVAVATGLVGLVDAARMVAAGEADAVVVAGRRYLPDWLEILGEGEFAPGGGRRPRRL